MCVQMDLVWLTWSFQRNRETKKKTLALFFYLTPDRRFRQNKYTTTEANLTKNLEARIIKQENILATIRKWDDAGGLIGLAKRTWPELENRKPEEIWRKMEFHLRIFGVISFAHVLKWSDGNGTRGGCFGHLLNN